jgi:hypothetical protein
MSDPLTAPLLIITNVGMAAAEVATPTGPFVNIIGFRVGSAFGYDPLPTDTDLNGTLLYSGVPSTYKYVGDNTLDVICKIPADAGPFNFGEVALDIAGPVMFAKAAFAVQQTKYSSLGTNVLSTYTFHCLIKLTQPVAIFKVDTLMAEPPMIWEVDHWADVYPPALSANPDIPSILVRELDANGNSSWIHQATDTHWSMGTNYHLVATPIVTGGTLNDVTVAAQINVNNTSTPRNYVIETEDGYMRACSSVTSSGGNQTFHFTTALTDIPPVVGSNIAIFCNDILQTTLIVTGDTTGQVILSGPTATLSLTIDHAAVLARSLSHTTAGTYNFTVPAGVNFLYADAGGGGGGAGGAGAGVTPDHTPGTEYNAGGGGGGGGVAETATGVTIPVNPGDNVVITVGAKGLGGAGGIAPGGNGAAGTSGAATIITVNSVVVLTLNGGQGASGGAGFGPPSGASGAGGAGGNPGGTDGTDGYFGSAGGPGASSQFGTGGAAARGATGPAGIPGGDAAGNCAGGGGGSACYISTSTGAGGKGGDGSDGLCNLTW